MLGLCDSGSPFCPDRADSCKVLARKVQVHRRTISPRCKTHDERGTMDNTCEQRWPTDEELEKCLMTFKMGDPLAFERAQTTFTAIVDPKVAYDENPSQDDIDYCNMAFSEWALFDFDFGYGTSLMDRAAMADDSLAEFAQSQFFSRFWVISQDRRHNTSVLRDMRTHEDFVVHSHHIAHRPRWAKGTLGVRLACVGDQWACPGKIFLHDNAPSDPEPVTALPKGRGVRDALAFIENFEQVYGQHGSYRDTLLGTEEF